MKTLSPILFILLALWLCPRQSAAQSGKTVFQVDLAALDGTELHASNLFHYRVINSSNQSQRVTITGRIQFRRSNLNFSYRYDALLQPGSNDMADKARAVSWTFSDNALKELFQTYDKLPQGTYEYCVSIQAHKGGEGSTTSEPEACVYNTVEDIFLINLMSPENDAKLHETNPMLSWTVNYHFASELTYRLRVAELKKGQTPVAAMTRNNPVYQDNHVMTTGSVYPVTARPLQKWQPYVWTVDAYYKGILLGGAEVWKFTIVDDSLLKGGPYDTYFVDIRQEHSSTTYYAVGKIKLKYVLEALPQESLQLVLRNDKGKVIRLPQNSSLQAVLGDNRFEIDLEQQADLKHMGQYTLELTGSGGNLYKLLFTYVNPVLVN